MQILSKQTCISCNSRSKSVTDEIITELKPQIPEWGIIIQDGERRLQRTYLFSNFQNALAFTQLVGEAAEKEGHHPSLLTEWGKVTATWWTHAIKGLHRNDFIMAAKSDHIYTKYI